MFASAASAPHTQGRASLPLVNPGFAQAVAEGLTKKNQKTLPPSWLYDAVGSALFEVITVLPEYGLTRAEESLLSSEAHEIVRASRRPHRVIELGSGAGSKTRHILAAAASAGEVHYSPIDISSAALDACTKVLADLKHVQIEPVEAGYLEGIDKAIAERKSGEHVLVLFLGSTIGNFDKNEADAFLRSLRKRLQPGDCLLLGADLVKSRARLLSAYDDPIGVTAAFNLNILARINRELDGRFDIAQFAHEARFNEHHSRVEMHLRSRIAQQVRIGDLDLAVSFSPGETIWTESSHKFRAEEITRIAERAGWSCVRQWVDPEWGFAETLFQTQ